MADKEPDLGRLFYNKKRKELVTPPSALVAGGVPNLDAFGQKIDRIQEALVHSLDLEGLSLESASKFLWPRATSIAAAQEPHGNWPFYISDAREMPGRIGSFPSVRPVIYFPRRFMADQSADLSNYLTKAQIDTLGHTVEIVGLCLNEQTQIVLHGRPPGDVQQSSLFPIHWYLVLRELVQQTSGKSIFDRDNPAGVLAVGSLNRMWQERANLFQSHPDRYDPFTSHFAKGNWTTRGLLEHLIIRDRAGEDTTEELSHFYKLQGPAKFGYLDALYRAYVREGNKDFVPYLGAVESGRNHEVEPGTQLRRGRVNVGLLDRIKSALLTG